MYIKNVRYVWPAFFSFLDVIAFWVLFILLVGWLFCFVFCCLFVC